MTRIYYTVVVRDDNNSPWGVHYGSYDYGEATEEAFEATQCGYKNTDVKVITTGEDQAEIDKAVTLLNV